MKTTLRTAGSRVIAAWGALFLMGCGGGSSDPASLEASASDAAEEPSSLEAPAAEGETSPAQAPVTPADPTPFQDLAAADILKLNQRWTGDYDDLAERRFLRVLVPFSRTLYYLDGPQQKGIAHEALRELEGQLPRIEGSKVRPKIVIMVS